MVKLVKGLDSERYLSFLRYGIWSLISCFCTEGDLYLKLESLTRFLQDFCNAERSNVPSFWTVAPSMVSNDYLVLPIRFLNVEGTRLVGPDFAAVNIPPHARDDPVNGFHAT